MSFRTRCQIPAWYFSWYDSNTLPTPPPDTRLSIHNGKNNHQLYERRPDCIYTENSNRVGRAAKSRAQDGDHIKYEYNKVKRNDSQREYMEERLFSWHLDVFFAENSLTEIGIEAARGYEQLALLSLEDRRRTNVSDINFFKLEVVNEVILAYSLAGNRVSLDTQNIGRDRGTMAAEGVINLAHVSSPDVLQCFHDIRNGLITWSGIWSFIEDWHKIYVRDLAPGKEASRVIMEEQEAEYERLAREQEREDRHRREREGRDANERHRVSGGHGSRHRHRHRHH